MALEFLAALARWGVGAGGLNTKLRTAGGPGGTGGKAERRDDDCTADPDNDPVMDLPKTLPASWYRSAPLYALERRAVFLKAWYLLGPVTRFLPDEPVRYEIAQVRLCASRGAGGLRDVSVVDEDTGLPLRSYITSSGLVFSTISGDAPSFVEFFPDLEPLLARVDFTRLPHRRSIRYEGKFNWKTMVDGYQECLHCQYTHPSFSVNYPPTFYSVSNHCNFSQHIADPAKPDDGLFLYFFPNCTLNVYGGGMSSFRVCPTTEPGVTRMEFDYYHVADGAEFESYFAFVRQVAQEDFELCEKAQANLEQGVYVEGVLNPDKETGVAFYQQQVLKLVVAQHEADKQRAGLMREAGPMPVRDGAGRHALCVQKATA
ncbi:Bet v1-like protein [Trichodelitschia bisporula]|uniref:Choline monooxygenase, chloroplastic n=1 Tax=Trichodelitschia bisporula TaxID=703511 RepID=A0A6G1HS36_9PEZI|nr:Bet v1-like protein [Trichodelitschia bisporula]